MCAVCMYVLYIYTFICLNIIYKHACILYTDIITYV